MSDTLTRPTATLTLSTEERLVLQLLSVLYVPTPITRIQTAIGACPRLPLRKIDTVAALRPIIESLQKKKLIDVKSGQYFCVPSVVEIVTRRAVRDGLLPIMAVALPPRQKTLKPQPTVFSWSTKDSAFTSPVEYMGHFRLAMYRHDEAGIKEMLDDSMLSRCPADPFCQICLNPFDAAWMDTLPSSLVDLMVVSLVRWARDAEPLDWLERRLLASTADVQHEVRVNLAWRATCQGRLVEARKLLAPSGHPTALATRGFIEMACGNAETAAHDYDQAVAQIRKLHGRKKETFHSDLSLLHVPALLACKRVDDAARLAELIATDNKHPLQAAYKWLSVAVRLSRGEPVVTAQLPANEPPDSESPVCALIGAAVHVWHDSAQAAALIPVLERRHAQAVKAENCWVAAEFAELLARVTGKPKWKVLSDELHGACGTKTILNAVTVKQVWERTLEALETFVAAAPATTVHETRLIWLLAVHVREEATYVQITPREQKRTASGDWTAGRAVALKRLFEDAARLTWLSDADRRVCACINGYRAHQYYNDVSFSIDVPAALPHLIGHPLVFADNPHQTRIDVVRGEPALVVQQKKDEFVLRLDPVPRGENEIAVSMEGTRTLKVYVFREVDLRLRRLLGEGCTVPASQAKRVSEALASIASVITVQGDGLSGEYEEIAADERLLLHLTPHDEGLQGRVWVAPLGPNGPLFVPGRGAASVMAEVDGRKVRSHRALAREREHWDALRITCDLPDVVDELIDLPDVESSVAFLDALTDLTDHVSVHWPQGVPWRVHRREWKDLRLRVSGDKEWFLVGGDVAVDESRVVALGDLLKSRRHGRFVALHRGEFLALTEAFERRLNEMTALAEVNEKGLHVHPLAVPLLAESVGNVRQAAWNKCVERFKNVADADVPTTLQTELRDYQVEGYRWLVRLARWGAGACLADDMGLGKTIQALALLLERAPQGPALIVAPTSVCANWMNEAGRFAPTLRTRLYAGADRASLLDDLDAFDVLVTSYTLMAQDASPLGDVNWNTAVLDEAQAIKNAATRRSQAAMGLRAGFRVALTGTPLENHPEELWNLFRFLNPGLLGSRERFEICFAAPLERGDAAARRGLKRLISPFMLRRTKSQVLQELPSRTEITLHVELSETERAAYEAIRREALSRLSEEGDRPERMRIFAALMRLRRACCHPRLVLKDDEAPRSSAKLEVFDDVLDELLENRHRALVFSQFVDHLTIVREHLECRGVSFQYLDGATSMKERELRVAAFQRGEGDVFLISLRAGGSGLNLTAADYVIHLDPWWNPAVEDQASDRAHRIGQQRPVTIYRLVARNTVEERIVDLHQRKRNLADSLLEGAEAASRISAEELLRLLAEDGM